MNKFKVIHILNQFLPLVTGYTIRSQEIIKYSKSFADQWVITKKIESSWKSNEKIQNTPVIRIFQYPIFFLRFLDPKIKNLNKIYRSNWGRRWKVDKWFRFLILPIWLSDVYRAKILQPAIDKMIFKKYLKKIKPDIIHGHTPFYMSLPMIQLAKKQGIPTIYEVRGVWEDTKVIEGVEDEGSKNYKNMRDLETQTMKLADRVVVISEGLRKDIHKRGIPFKKIELVSNGVDIKNFKPMGKDQDLIKKLKLNNKTVLGYIGTIRKFEGLQIVFKALSQLKNKNLIFLIIGYGEYESQLKKLATELKIEDRVIFAGKIDPSKINQYYSIIDICVYPRIKAKVCEIVTPLKPLEAMAMEKFVLASDVGGLRELVKNGINGILFKADNITDLIAKIKSYQDFKKRDSITHQARKWVKDNRDWRIIAKKYQKIYQRIKIQTDFIGH